MTGITPTPLRGVVNATGIFIVAGLTILGALLVTAFISAPHKTVTSQCPEDAVLVWGRNTHNDPTRVCVTLDDWADEASIHRLDTILRRLGD